MKSSFTIVREVIFVFVLLFLTLLGYRLLHGYAVCFFFLLLTCAAHFLCAVVAQLCIAGRTNVFVLFVQYADFGLRPCDQYCSNQQPVLQPSSFFQIFLKKNFSISFQDDMDDDDDDFQSEKSASAGGTICVCACVCVCVYVRLQVVQYTVYTRRAAQQWLSVVSCFQLLAELEMSACGSLFSRLFPASSTR